MLFRSASAPTAKPSSLSPRPPQRSASPLLPPSSAAAGSSCWGGRVGDPAESEACGPGGGHLWQGRRRAWWRASLAAAAAGISGKRRWRGCSIRHGPVPAGERKKERREKARGKRRGRCDGGRERVSGRCETFTSLLLSCSRPPPWPSFSPSIPCLLFSGVT